MIKSFKQLIVWQKSVKLVTEIYKVTSNLPKSEVFGLSSQMRRAAVAIPSNIAEGKYRKSRKGHVNFLRISLGSAAELETQLIICKELYKKIDYGKCFSLLEEVQKMLVVMINRLQKPTT